MLLLLLLSLLLWCYYYYYYILLLLYINYQFFRVSSVLKMLRRGWYRQADRFFHQRRVFVFILRFKLSNLLEGAEHPRTGQWRLILRNGPLAVGLGKRTYLMKSKIYATFLALRDLGHAFQYDMIRVHGMFLSFVRCKEYI